MTPPIAISVPFLSAPLFEGRGASAAPASRASELSFGETLARRQGYESLEAYLMLVHGYEASTRLPRHWRRHAIDDADLAGPLTKEQIGQRRKDLRQRLRKAGSTGCHLENLMLKILHAEMLHPDLFGSLRPSDFATRLPGIVDLVPRGKRPEKLIAAIARKRRDAFPEWNLTPTQPQDQLLRGLATFLQDYREADRIFRDGGIEHAHCSDSANLVAGLLLLKGFEAFAVWTARVPDHAMAEDMGWMIEGLMQATGGHPRKTMLLLERFEDGMSESDICTLAEGFDLFLRDAPEAHAHLASLNARKRKGIASAIAKSEMHAVTALLLGATFFLIDIDAHQFGPASERVVMVEEAHAAREGIIPFMPLDEEKTRLDFLSRLRPWESHFARKQRIIREYLKLKGVLPAEHPSRAHSSHFISIAP
jgi:hypothetical protein